VHDIRLCEERSDEAIQARGTALAALDCRAAKRRLAMTDFSAANARVFVLMPERSDIDSRAWMPGSSPGMTKYT
jgi:hypothetical protein